MKKTILLFAFVATTLLSFGQITVTKVTPKIDKTDTTYDSIQNYLGKEVNKYLGQELYLKGIHESSQKRGYEYFYTDYTKSRYDKGYIYKDNGSYRSEYNELNGKYFKVLEIIKHPKAYDNILYVDNFYLKLEEKISKDIVYFEYTSKYDLTFPFIVVGFFEKQKSLILGKEFIFTDKLLKTSEDFETAEDITIKTGQVWKCIDLTIHGKYYSLKLVIQNTLGEKAVLAYDDVFGKYGKGQVYSKLDVDKYKKKFGTAIFNTILQGKVSIGMTKEMCKISWGEPESINKTITASNKSEQWVYSENYLYFDNGILTAIQ